MLMRLARQTYVRQYGEFTCLFGKVTAFDQVFRSAGPFFAHLTRSPRERDEIVDKIVRDYADAPRDVVARDFDELFAPLIAERVVLAGGSAAELDAMEPAFTYDCDDPKTAKDTRRHTYEEIAALPATMLEKYFAVHPTLFELQMDVTQAFPGVRPCFAHCRPMDEMAAVVAAHPNVYTDTAYMDEVGIAALPRHDWKGRLMFGTDLPVWQAYEAVGLAERYRRCVRWFAATGIAEESAMAFRRYAGGQSAGLAAPAKGMGWRQFPFCAILEPIS